MPTFPPFQARHLQEKHHYPPLCHWCGLTFPTSQTLHSHLAVHFLRQHECQTCGQRFFTQQQLDGHCYKVHGIWPETRKVLEETRKVRLWRFWACALLGGFWTCALLVWFGAPAARGVSQGRVWFDKWSVHVLPHWGRSCWSNLLSPAVTVRYSVVALNLAHQAFSRAATRVPIFNRHAWLRQRKRGANSGSTAAGADALPLGPPADGGLEDCHHLGQFRARMHHKVVGNFGSEADVQSL